MFNAQDVVEKTREYLGVKWLHTGRSKELGVDCTGLVLCVYNDLGANIEDFTDYGMSDGWEAMIFHLRREFSKVDNLLPGDIVVFRSPEIFNHVAIMISDTHFIHAYSVPSVMRVVEGELTGYWKQRIRGIYRYKGFIK